MAHLLISQSYLKDKSVINDNVDFKILTPVIELVQDKHILPLLGSDLFELIKTQSTPPTTLTAANQTLLDDYILKAMVHYILAESVSSFRFRYMNKGILTKTAENAQPISREEAKDLYDENMSNAQFYAGELKKYITRNQTSFPAYFTSGDVGETPASATAFDCDIYLPNDGTYFSNEEL
jgi:hypothetical protein